MKVILSDQNIIRSPETLTSLLKRRIILLWNYKIINIVQNIVFKPLSVPYEIVLDGGMYNIYFDNKVLLDLVSARKGISDFDQYLMEIENHLIWKV